MSGTLIVDPPVLPPLPEPPRRRRGLLIAGALLVIAAVVVTAAVVVLRHRDADARHNFLGADNWPTEGQAAYVIGRRAPQESPGQQPAPIASLAKVMTAYVVLRDLPLGHADPGPTLTVTPADVRDYDARHAQDQSVVEVVAGEHLTERDALMGLLLPSANNMAAMLARYDAGSVTEFVKEMNRTARHLGMDDTTYTDPSGYAESTVSTAHDQLLLARAIASNKTLTAMVATRSYTLPVAGLVQNTDTLLGIDGFIGTKTGSDDAAGSCFMFAVQRWIVTHRHGHEVTVIGVVLGQPGNNLILTGQYAARQLVDAVAPSAPTP